MTFKKHGIYKPENKPDVLSMIIPGQDKVKCYEGIFIH